ncbi:hypothetical protein CWE12_01440 [Aliidiomarina sedimenti]|uniref:KOW domain-containing protein n=2 Tax=Aliidiomarina TaxID=1249554 RepID=A0A432WMR8_9GAMM|nr:MULTISPECIES: DUF3912 family protein [Aliidiomarina]RUO31688.1 hypothetical protein CWE12_01440 [Aliidiomarina sedimenti]RUO35048.1 hypothetical protein CWE14_03365 [Aliidiomarina soli]
MAGVCFTYNSRQFLGQTVFVKRGAHQGKMGQVIRELDDERYQVSLGDFGQETVVFDRSDFLVHRYRKIKVPVSRT